MWLWQRERIKNEPLGIFTICENASHKKLLLLSRLHKVTNKEQFSE